MHINQPVEDKKSQEKISRVRYGPQKSDRVIGALAYMVVNVNNKNTEFATLQSCCCSNDSKRKI